ncbi:MAG: Nif11-like leader peptide family natural product precursor [Ruminiclostridium sp.]|nr:Nif11-like leader peptide family natural product precursor [Ruminiclostridium sp.]
MANNNAAKEFLNKVISDEALKVRLADKTPAQAAEVAAELGYEATAEELIAAEKELRAQSAPSDAQVVELDLEDMDRAAGGARDWAEQGCAATVEAGSLCWSNDSCIISDVIYINSPVYSNRTHGNKKKK